MPIEIIIITDQNQLDNQIVLVCDVKTIVLCKHYVTSNTNHKLVAGQL